MLVCLLLCGLKLSNVYLYFICIAVVFPASGELSASRGRFLGRNTGIWKDACCHIKRILYHLGHHSEVYLIIEENNFTRI